jgi:transmembrane sensor
MNPADRNDGGPKRGDEPHPLDWLDRTGTADALLRELEVRSQGRTRRGRTVAVAVAALLMSVGAMWRVVQRGATPVPAAAASAVVLLPERRVLTDGSVVELKEGAAIDVDFSSQTRRVVLQRGEAHFQVAKNETVPFVVAVRGVEVRAVGTAFAVSSETASVEVIVTEGRVAVEDKKNDAATRSMRLNAGRNQRPAASEPQPVAPLVVDAGTRVTVAPAAVAPEVTAVSPADLKERLAWRVPRIEFSGTPLSEAIPMFNAHSAVRVSLGEPSLGRLLLSGILRADNVDALVRLLEANYEVMADRSDGTIVLRRRQSASPR